MQFRDLRRQYVRLQDSIDRAVSEVIASGSYIMGPAVTQLEQDLATYTGVRHVITCANGTDALTLALKAMNIGRGDAVFIPDFTFFATAEAVAREGATPVFVDVDRYTYNIDPQSLQEAVRSVTQEGTLRPRATIGVDLFGLPAPWQQIQAVAQQWNMLTIEDGAQGFGGRVEGQRACSFADIATTSFFPAKPLGCYGDGGAVFTNDERWAALMASLRVHGKGASKYDNVRIGLNSRLDTVQAAILSVKLQAFVTEELSAVNRIAARYAELLAPLAGRITLPTVPTGFSSSWAQYTIVLPHDVQRGQVQQSLQNDGIPSMVYYPKRMSDQEAFRQLQRYVSTPNAEMLCQRVLSLPIDPYKSEEEIARVASSLFRAIQ